MTFHLPTLTPHRSALEKCVYCPKLSRASCPVSNVEGSETLTPWGKMSMAYFAARGDVPIDREHAEPAWACSGCFACKQRCDHNNDVADILFDARADFFKRGAAPASAQAVSDAQSERAAKLKAAVQKAWPEQRKGPPVLVGCSYVLHLPTEANDAVRALDAVTKATHAPMGHCCGLPLLEAGDRAGFLSTANRFADSLRRASAEQCVVVDPGCARVLLQVYPRFKIPLPQVKLWIDVIDQSPGLTAPGSAATLSLRYHDPCQLGRGLERYEEPRRIIERVTGRRPLEFARSRASADCSGGGGLLPVTRPDTSRAMAEARLADHDPSDGTAVVTACAQSVRRFRAAKTETMDIVSLVANALST